MTSESQIFEWTFASESDEGDALWKRESAAHAQPLQPHRSIKGRWTLRVAVTLGILIVATGWWFWRAGLGGLEVIEDELQMVVDTEMTLTASMPKVAPTLLDQEMSYIWKWTIEHEPVTGKSNEQLIATVADFEVHNEIAIVAVELRPAQQSDANGTVYRQTRFYRQTDDVWVRTEPVAELWGEPGSLQTEHLEFYFQERDALAVAQVGQTMESIYVDLTRSLALPLPSEPVKIEVSVTHPPAVELPWRTPLLVPSPALYQAPVQVSDVELLESSLALVLLQEVRTRSFEVHAMWTFGQILVDGLLLYKLWTNDEWVEAMPVDLMRIVYDGEQSVLQILEDGGVQHPPCVLQSQLPIMSLTYYLSPRCAGVLGGQSIGNHWRTRTVFAPPKRLDEFFLFSPTWVKYRQSPPSYLTQELDARSWDRYAGPDVVIALVTLLDYAVETYGEGRLPDLVRMYGEYQSWEEIIPAVFGVPPAEFEAGWQAYLRDRYGIMID